MSFADQVPVRLRSGADSGECVLHRGLVEISSVKPAKYGKGDADVIVIGQIRRR